MSLKERILNLILSKSNSYKFYKENYELLLNKNNELKTHEISNLENKINRQQDYINIIQGRLDNISNDLIKISDLKNKKIAYVLYSFPVHSETFVVNEIKWLKEHNYDVTVFKWQDSDKPVNLDFQVKTIKFDDESQLEKLLVENEIDFIHTHFVYPMCTNFTYVVAEKLKIPFTVFAHAVDIFARVNDKRNKVKEISESKFCKAVFTLSEFHKNYLIDRGVDERKIIITKQATGYELENIKISDNKIKNIVSVSRFVEKKGLDVLINAAKILENENYEFSIYGFGDLKDDLQNQIDELNCNNISIKGELPPNEVKNILKGADLLVSPCKIAENGDMDGFPTVIFEAMAVGLPILTTKVSAIPEIIKDGENGFITEPENPELFAKKINEISMISNEELFEIRKKAQDDVKNISSVENTMTTFVNVVES